MTLTVKHTHQTAIADDGSDVGANAWNADHTVVDDRVFVDTGGFVDYFVDASAGSDTTGTGAVGNPWKTIQHAVNWITLHVSSVYDFTVFVTVNIQDGTYNENVFLGQSNGNSAGNNFGLYGVSGTAANVIIAGKVICSGGNWYASRITAQQFGATDGVFRIDTCRVNGGGAPHFTCAPTTATGYGGILSIGGITVVTVAAGYYFAQVGGGGYISLDHGAGQFSVDPQYAAVLNVSANGRMSVNTNDFGWSNAGGYTGPKYALNTGGRLIFTSVFTTPIGVAAIPGTGSSCDSSSVVIDCGTIVDAHFVGDSGSGGKIGYVPAPAAGDAAAGKFLKADATWTAVSSPTGASPSATASDTAVNGSAATFMRSDGAPAVQKTSASVFGLCKVDNVTVTATGGIISSTGGSASLTINSSVVTGGTTGEVLYSDGSHILQQAANFTISSGNPNVASGHSYLYNGVNAVYGDTSLRSWFFGDGGTLAASGAANYGIGHNAASSLTSGHDNILIGDSAGNGLNSGSGNIAIGTNAMSSVTGAHDSNVAIGGGAYSGGAGGQNTMVGVGAGPGITGSNNAGLGAFCFSSATSGGDNLGIGFSALQSLNGGSFNCAMGSGALTGTITGSNNFGFGANSFSNNTSGNDNVGIGANSGQNNISGIRNICIGSSAGNAMHTDWGNTFIGYLSASAFNAGAGALTYNICIGADSGHNLSTGIQNTIISSNEQGLSTANQCIVIGYACGLATGTNDGEIVIGNYIYGKNCLGTASSVSTGRIGIGIPSPTAFLHLQNSTTGHANLRFDPTSAAGPTSPNDGDMWYDGTNLKFRHGGVTTTIV